MKSSLRFKYQNSDFKDNMILAWETLHAHFWVTETKDALNFCGNELIRDP